MVQVMMLHRRGSVQLSQWALTPTQYVHINFIDRGGGRLD